jgi:hypothetical protein
MILRGIGKDKRAMAQGQGSTGVVLRSFLRYLRTSGKERKYEREGTASLSGMCSLNYGTVADATLE